MRRHPDWLKVKIGGGESYVKMKSLLRSVKLHTICEEAKCPNIAECFGSGTAVFLILGDICTRNCRYCYVKHGEPSDLNLNEPKDIAESVKHLGLKYVIITSVTRDDLEDGGASVFSDTISEIRKLNKVCKIEVLIPDFKGDINSLKKVIDAKPDVINHNIEVVKDLFEEIRPQGNYEVSLKILNEIKKLNKDVNTTLYCDGSHHLVEGGIVDFDADLVFGDCLADAGQAFDVPPGVQPVSALLPVGENQPLPFIHPERVHGDAQHAGGRSNRKDWSIS